jgi:outer membrane assembly lipoprotein YfiO
MLKWFKANKTHPLRDRGLLLMAKALYQYGDRIRAFYYCDELMDTYPESSLFYPALELQYRIADAYLQGYKSRFLRIPMFEQKDEAVEMLFRIQRRSPGSPLAEQALLRTADYYYDSGQFDLAADTYATYARPYPRSTELSRVLLLQAYSNLALYRGPRFDPTPMIDAQQQLRDYASRFPQQARQQQVPELLEQIELDQARKLFLTGDFYQRTHKPRAARHLYAQVIEDHPDSPQALQARERLDRLNPEPSAPATAPTAALP